MSINTGAAGQVPAAPPPHGITPAATDGTQPAATGSSHPPLLRMIGIEKSFGPVRALRGVDFEVAPRQVHGLLGGNGAGKTTLMNVLYGLYAADAGRIELDGSPVSIHSPKDAITHGIGMVHQSFLQVDTFSVTENVVLGTGTDLAPAAKTIAELSEHFGLAVDPAAIVGDLPVGVRQRVEILKALYRKAKVLVLDEPTTNLTPQEVDALFGSLRTIVDEGMSVILITHKIRETMAACDVMTVMRDGQKVTTVARADTSPDALAALMVGDAPVAAAAVATLTAEPGADGNTAAESIAAVPVSPSGDTAGDSAGSPHVEITGVTVTNDAGVEAVHAATLRLARGEILGISGVAGNGQTELAEAITGVRPLRGGSVRLDGENLAGLPTARWLSRGVVYVPEDRQRDGILPAASIAENLLLGRHRSLRRHGLIDWRAAKASAVDVIDEYSIRTPGFRTPAGQLSGGNIQRMILARAFRRSPRLLLLHNPTRGLDIASTQFVYERVREAAHAGCSVIVISEDLDEILALSQRISIIYSGSIVSTIDRADADPYQLGRLMTGVSE